MDVTYRRGREFFFDRPAVMKRVGKARRRILSKAGALVRTTARRSIRKPRRTRMSELDSDQQNIVRIRRKIAEKQGKPKPRLPFAPSRPGEAPRTPTGILRKSIAFSYDPNTDSVVCGPEKLNKGTNAPSVLEYGGRNNTRNRVAPRPFINPALKTVARKYPSFWKDAIR